MPEPLSILTALRRPRLLVRAAHLGSAAFDRDRALRRLFPEGMPPSSGMMFDALRIREAEIDAERRSGGATYSVARHVEVLSAMIVEARRTVMTV